MLTIEDRKILDDFKKAPMAYASLYNICLNFNKLLIGETEVKSLFNLISNLLNLSRISIIFTNSSKRSFEAISLLSPLAKLVNLSSAELKL